jgi:hypothetical protein
VIRKLVISNGRSERELLLVGNIVIGRDPACHVSEPDPLLSRRHAEVLASVHGVSIRDLNSRNGILVNGEKTTEQVLLPGDVVQLGHLQLRYVEEAARPADGLVSRGIDRRPPEAPAAPAFDRFRPEPAAAQPGRWKPDPTPLPGRRTTAPAAPVIQPPPASPAPSFTPVPRGRAAFPQDIRPGSQPGDQTIFAPVHGAHDTTLGPGPVDLDATVLAPAGTREPSGVNRWSDPDATLLADAPASGQTPVPGHETFVTALAHLEGLTTPGSEKVRPGPGARISANAELTITDATPGCADLLGVPGEALVGDSLTDIFLRAVRRAYADPASTVSLTIARGPRGSITVTLSTDHTDGTEE